MSRFPAFENDLEFVKEMVTEESVFCLPGQVSLLTDILTELKKIDSL